MIESKENADTISEIRSVFDREGVPRFPWGLQNNGSGTYNLVDKDGMCIYQLSVPDHGVSINSAERANARDIIENSAFYISELLKDHRRLIDLCYDMKEAMDDARSSLEAID